MAQTRAIAQEFGFLRSWIAPGRKGRRASWIEKYVILCNLHVVICPPLHCLKEEWGACLESREQPWGRWWWQALTRAAGNALSQHGPEMRILWIRNGRIEMEGPPWVWLLRLQRGWHCWTWHSHDEWVNEMVRPPWGSQSGSSPLEIMDDGKLYNSKMLVLYSPLVPRCWAFERWKLQWLSPVYFNHHHVVHVVFSTITIVIFTWGGNHAAETAAGADATTIPGIPFRIAATWQRIVKRLHWTHLL